MTDEMTLDLWRLATDLTVVDAAILIAGGDPSDVDHEPDTFGNYFPVKRTDGHLGYLAAFTSLTAAIRKGYLRAEFSHPKAQTIGAHDDHATKILLVTPENLERMTKGYQNAELSGASEHPPPGPHEVSFRIFVEPDWSETTIDVEDLKAWLRSRGFTTGFFFPLQEGTEEGPEAFMDPSHPHFAPELALAVAAWRGLEGKSGFVRGSKEAISGWIDSNPDAWLGETELSTSAKDRIVTITNWRKSGGAPASGG